MNINITPLVLPESPLAWTADTLVTDLSWSLKIPTEAEQDIERLAAWAEQQEDAEQVYQAGCLEMPAINAFGATVLECLHQKPGFVHITGLSPEYDDTLLRLVYLALGLVTGPALDNYGRLYDVTDRGEDYRTSTVPVSMSRAATRFHTDSSARDVEPDHVGLLCLQVAIHGGDSLVTSALSVHETMREKTPALLGRLYRDFPRDVITPGMQRNLDSIRANRFPVFHYAPERGELTFRYMRYWIERAAELIDEPLDPQDIVALDALDASLNDPHLVWSAILRRGEMLWVNNRTMAHDRKAYEDEPGRPRRMVRMWTLKRPML